MKKTKICYLVYDYYLDIPAGVFDTVQELSLFFGRGTATMLSQISRIKSGKIAYTKDKKGHKYLIYRIELGEEINE